MTTLNDQAIRKLVPFHRIKAAVCGDGDLTAYLSRRAYRLIAGASRHTELQRSDYSGLVEIAEVPAPIDPETLEAFERLSCAYLEVHEALSSYQPIMVRNFEQHRRWTQAEVRLNVITKALSELVYPFEDLSVLDMGCVIGFMSLAFDSFGCDVTGIDIDRPALSVAAAYKDIVRGSVNFMEADAVDFVFNCRRTYDVVLCINLLHWLWKQRKDEPQAASFIQRLADLTNIALFIATPFDASSGLVDLIPEGESKIDALRRWCDGRFGSVQFLASGPRHPMYVCVK